MRISNPSNTENHAGYRKPYTVKDDWKSFGVLQKIAACIAVAALVLVAVTIVAGVYLLVGWGLVAALAFITGGAVALNALQGALIVLILAFVANMFRRR